AQLTQLLHVAEQLAIDVVFDFRHFAHAPAGLLAAAARVSKLSRAAPRVRPHAKKSRLTPAARLPPCSKTRDFVGAPGGLCPSGVARGPREIAHLVVRLAPEDDCGRDFPGCGRGPRKITRLAGRA